MKKNKLTVLGLFLMFALFVACIMTINQSAQGISTMDSQQNNSQDNSNTNKKKKKDKKSNTNDNVNANPNINGR